MKTFNVTVTETLQKVVAVKANNEDEAVQKVADAYYDDRFELDSIDIVEVTFGITDDVGSYRTTNPYILS